MWSIHMRGSVVLVRWQLTHQTHSVWSIKVLLFNVGVSADTVGSGSEVRPGDSAKIHFCVGKNVAVRKSTTLESTRHLIEEKEVSSCVT